MNRSAAAGDVLIVYPHQLFRAHPGLNRAQKIFLVEDRRFFFDPEDRISFHKQKLIFHRAALRHYQDRLTSQGRDVEYIAHREALVPDHLERRLAGVRPGPLVVADPEDRVLSGRLEKLAARTGRELRRMPSPAFLTSRGWIEDFFGRARHYSQNSFYIAQRRRLNILLEQEKPLGGKWSFDSENRKRIPAGVSIPPLPSPREEAAVREARAYVEKHFPGHPGDTTDFVYPVAHEDCRAWLAAFFRTRLPLFGDYQDGMVRREAFLFHSLLSPLLNAGLLTPGEVLQKTLDYVRAHPDRVPLNALEGFLRQIIGWREFVRAVYLLEGEREREANFWWHGRPLPSAFYARNTGIEPVDEVLRRVNRFAYAHHIERLMVLGNFLLLCEIDPREVYRWFMEMFIDAYDWVMVPNVFGMSQFADGGLITTKPYCSSSRYILKMSDYAPGAWCAVWDGLYWRFLHRHREYFSGNPRLSVMVSQMKRMGAERIAGHLRTAEDFLKRLHES